MDSREQIATVSSTHALLVGVNDYSSFDGTGTWDLLGSVNDVVLLAWYCQEVLGIPGENIHVLSTPKLTAEQVAANDALEALRKLPSSHLGEASEENVKAAVARLLEATKGKGQTALFAFSGHGAWSSEAGPVLCLGGVKEGFGKGVLALRELRRSIENASARSRFVAILDCCHVAGPSIGSRLHVTALPHRGKVADVVASAKAGDFDVCDRVLLGAEPGQSAYQMRLGTHRRGALTFSLVTAAERWRASGGRSHGSYKQVLKRAKKVVKALEVPQTVKMVAPAAQWKAIRKEPFLSVTAGPTTREPDVKRRSAQIDPNWLYKIYISDPVTKAQTLLAQIVATPGGPSGPGATNLYVTRPGCSPVNLGERYPGQECWYVNDAAVRQIASAVQLDITSEALPASNTPESSLQLDPSVSGQPNNSLPLFRSLEQAWWNDTGYQYTSGKSYYFLGQESVSVGSGWSSLPRWLQLCVTNNDNGSVSLTGVQWWVNTTYGMPDGATFQPANASPYPSNPQGPQSCLGWRSL